MRRRREMSQTNVMLIDPVANSATPPLDLLRQATVLRERRLEPELRRGIPHESWPEPSEAIFTAVFSWHYPLLASAVRTARELWPHTRLTLSGVLARRMGARLADKLGVETLNGDLETFLDESPPDYSLVPEWDASILITSKGVCPRECSHCDASWRGKGVTRLIASWQEHLDPRMPRVEVWDNTLMLTPRTHYEKLANELADFKRPVDFVCGIATGGVPEEELAWRINKLRGVRLCPARLECNRIQELDRLRRLLAVTQRALPDSEDFRAFAVINGSEGPVEAWRRLEGIEAAGVKPELIVFTPHEWLRAEPYVHTPAGWSLGDLKSFGARWPTPCA